MKFKIHTPEEREAFRKETKAATARMAAQPHSAIEAPFDGRGPSWRSRSSS